MVKKIALHFWSIRHQFFRYFSVGLSGLFFDMGSLYLLTDYFHILPVFAVMINGLFMINYIFLLNKYWTFKSTGVTHKQMIRFFILSIFNYFFAIGWMYVFNHELGLNDKLVRLSNIILAVAWNFLIYKYWVYSHVPAPIAIETEVEKV
ncbi:MAG: GtrA family protein [Candidatus Magasanikbacteria bacterium]|nr:GtrA family protein [Candidatus Magasanikbacteria bacterium]